MELLAFIFIIASILVSAATVITTAVFRKRDVPPRHPYTTLVWGMLVLAVALWATGFLIRILA